MLPPSIGPKPIFLSHILSKKLKQYFVVSHYVDHVALEDAYKRMDGDDERRRLRELNEREEERRVLESIEAAQARNLVERQLAEDEGRMASELERRLKDMERKTREVQRLRDESDELRKLQELIKTAKMNRERHMQVQEKVVMVEQRKQYDAAFDQVMSDRLVEEHRREEALEAERREAGHAAKRVLEEQMEERKEQQRVARLEYERERALVDEIVRKIEEEDRLESEAKRRKQEETKDYIRNFLIEQEVSEKKKEKHALTEALTEEGL